MLILSRKLNESIVIDGRIVVKILRIDKDTVKLGIQAPAELPVHRQEIYDVIQKNKLNSVGIGQPATPRSPSEQANPNPANPVPTPVNGPKNTD